MPEHDGQVTHLLHAWRAGHPEAEEDLWTLVYRELKTLARAVLRGRRAAPGPQTTTLVHEAFLRLVGSADHDYRDRRHFFAIAARAMRFVLVDEARRRLAGKRDAGAPATETPESLPAPAARSWEEVLAVHQALDRLAGVNPRHAQLVELRYFVGLSVEETADVLEVSRPTVVRDWQRVRVWLHGELEAAGA